MVAAAVVGFLFGGIWYGVLGKSWMAALGKTEAEIKARRMEVAPMIITQRQPATPNGVSGNSRQHAKATAGTAMNCTAWLIANARPRTRAGAISEM